MRGKKLYGAHIYYPQISGDVIFEYSELPIVGLYKNMIETRSPYFIGPNHSTRFFDLEMLNKENKITKELTTFYSDNKESCVLWLEEKRKDYLDDFKYEYDRLRASKIVEKKEDE